ncbi:auxin-responsive protein SAUR50 [Solanum pennellii]|uniref:Auxin-responsive protein SAUR50 n=1 Tax=Solanum pennellii TaxID=28526 RepID=A0ABM1HLK8_SOLPN|nr:auxin-responsive protein SAUR50 [Solanum pennellii]
MKMMDSKFLKACQNKWQKMGGKVIPSSACCDKCCKWSMWPFEKEEKSIPRDVPKGHVVVYVGKYQKRFVIKITLLKHPLFKALLDQAQEVYEFTADSKLWIPCDENIFNSVIRCATLPESRRISICF